MARRGGRGGRSSRGRSSGGRSSKSRSRSRSSSKSRSSGRKSSAKSTRSSSSGRKARKTTTSRPRRTTRTVSPKARRATQRTAKARPRVVRRTAVVRRASPVKNRRLTGIGRINRKPITRQQAISNLSQLSRASQQRQKQTSLQARQQSFQQTMTRGFTAGGTNTVNVTFANGQQKRLNLSVAAIRTYQKAGLKVSPISFTIQGGSKFPTPAIQRIINPSQAWTNPQGQNQLHVSQQMRVKPNTRTNSNFGGLGANPWNPVEALTGLFNVSPQQQPASQWLPQRSENIINPDRPTYTAMTTGLQQAAAFEESPEAFSSQMMGTNAYNPTDVRAEDRIKDLFQNKYVLYAGLAVGAIVALKLIMSLLGGGKQVVYR